jgi:hypothetical protein
VAQPSGFPFAHLDWASIHPRLRSSCSGVAGFDRKLRPSSAAEKAYTAPARAASLLMMARVLALVLAYLLGRGALAQDESKAAMEWATGLGGRFRELHNSVTATFATATLATLVCAKDKAQGSELFRGALSGLNLLTPASFNQRGPVLPVSSYAGLWKFIVPAALKCDPDLSQFTAADSSGAKLDDERRQANRKLKTALEVVDSNPDRAAQLAGAALAASVPLELDFDILLTLLSKLRDRAPDLSDELFPEALDFVTSDRAPSTGLMQELGKYLFTSQRARGRTPAENEDQDESFQVGQSSIFIFRVTRKNVGAEDIRAYLNSALAVLTATQDPNYDPVIAYALALQMLPMTIDAPDLEESLRKVLGELEPQIGDSAAQLRVKLNDSRAPDRQGDEALRLRDRRIGQVLSAVSGKRFTEAREMLKGVDELAARSQITVLIDFAESANASRRGDTQWAFTLANTLRPGIKRSLLYAGIVAGAPNREAASGLFQLALRDIELLPAEQRIYTLCALANAIRRVDPDGFLLATGQAVAAQNDAYDRPRRGRFDPNAVRKIYTGGSGSGTDSPLILHSRYGLYEIVDSGQARHRFTLHVAGADAFSLAAAVRNAAAVDPARLEAIVVALRDENQIAKALNALADLRLNGGRDRTIVAPSTVPDR